MRIYTTIRTRSTYPATKAVRVESDQLESLGSPQHRMRTRGVPEGSTPGSDQV